MYHWFISCFINWQYFWHKFVLFFLSFSLGVHLAFRSCATCSCFFSTKFFCGFPFSFEKKLNFGVVCANCVINAFFSVGKVEIFEIFCEKMHATGVFPNFHMTDHEEKIRDILEMSRYLRRLVKNCQRKNGKKLTWKMGRGGGGLIRQYPGKMKWFERQIT